MYTRNEMNELRPGRRAKVRVVAVGLWMVFAGLVVGCDRDDSSPEVTDSEHSESPEDDEQTDESDVPDIYGGLDQAGTRKATDVGPPAPALYFLSGLKGYTEPCGCTADVMLGGIERITAYVRDAVELHSDALFVDAGDWLFEYDDIPEHQRAQEKAKAEVLADAHRRMETRFSVPGNRDLALGVEFYRSMMERAEMEAMAANLKLEGDSLPGSTTVELDGDTLLLVGAVEAELYADIDGADAVDEFDAVASIVDDADADAVAVIYQGRGPGAEALIDEVDGIDFLVVGHDPQLNEDAVQRRNTQILEAYDQGRYVGRLKLYGLDTEGAFFDGRSGIRGPRERLDGQIGNVRSDLRELEVRTGGEETPMTRRLQGRLDDLEEQRETLLREGIEIPDGQPAFVYGPVAMEPEYRVDDVIQQRRHEFNQSLEALIAEIDRDPLPVDDGDPFFVGQARCQDCHAAAHDFWENTSHASAVETLEVRHKQFDQNCIGCHVDGWEQPGGSVLGSIEYEAELGGETFTKDLHEVGCESCHGPGSNHLLNPLDDDGQPHNIVRSPGEQQCTQCHVPEHSPTFDFDVYVDQITGEGHEYSGSY